MIVVMLTKYPTPGTVMTRIGKVIGMQEAANLQRELLELLIPRYQKASFDFIVATLTKEDAKKFETEFHVQTMLQRGNDLGSRMYNAIADLLQTHDKVVLVGSDVPTMNAHVVDQALSYLDAKDIVFGPATDGGYYLVAMSKPQDIFSEITYSTSTVLQETLDRCKSQGLSTMLLPEMSDIDTVDDLRAWRTTLDK